MNNATMTEAERAELVDLVLQRKLDPRFREWANACNLANNWTAAPWAVERWIAVLAMPKTRAPAGSNVAFDEALARKTARASFKSWGLNRDGTPRAA